MADKSKPKFKPNKYVTEPPKDTEEGEVVWMSCRAKGVECDGQQAMKVYVKKQPFTNRRGTVNPGGGTSVRYKCTTCERPWHITF